MVHQVYTVRDKVSELCGPLFQAVNHGVASRQVVGLLSKIPAYDRDSYVLWFLGSWDDSTGVFGLNAVPEVIDVTIPRFSDIEQRKFGFVPEEE